jgi:hypothetical protein
MKQVTMGRAQENGINEWGTQNKFNLNEHILLILIGLK